MKRNYVYLGPVHIKVSNKGLAPWGFPRLRIGGLRLFTWCNDGGFNLASYHPRSSITWLWCVSVSWPRPKTMRRAGWWKPGRWVSPIKRGWSFWALGFGVSWSRQDRMPWPSESKEQSG